LISEITAIHCDAYLCDWTNLACFQKWRPCIALRLN